MRLHQPSGRGRQGRGRYTCCGQLALHVRQPALDAQDLQRPPFKRAEADLPPPQPSRHLRQLVQLRRHRRGWTWRAAAGCRSRRSLDRRQRRQSGLDRVRHERAVVAGDVPRAERSARTKPEQRRPASRFFRRGLGRSACDLALAVVHRAPRCEPPSGRVAGDDGFHPRGLFAVQSVPVGVDALQRIASVRRELAFVSQTGHGRSAARGENRIDGVASRRFTESFVRERIPDYRPTCKQSLDFFRLSVGDGSATA